MGERADYSLPSEPNKSGSESKQRSHRILLGDWEAYQIISSIWKKQTCCTGQKDIISYGKDIISGTCKYYVNDLAFHNYLYNGYGYGIGYLLENRIYLDLKITGYDVYVGVIKNREVDYNYI